MASLPLIDKLAHPLPDVRRRALLSLQFKLQHGLLDAASLAGAGTLVAAERLLSFLLSPLQPGPGGAHETGDALIALELLALLATQPGAAAQLLQLGADQALIRVADELPGCSQPASALLGELLCCGAAHPDGHPLPAACASTAVGTDAAPVQISTPMTQLGCSAAAEPEPSPWASPSSLLWAAASPAAAPGAAAASRHSTPPPAAVASALSAGSRRIKAVQLSEDDSQQLFEVALELQPERAEAAGEAALLATLATLRHGVLADMPVAGVAGEPALLQALLRLLDGARSRPAAAAAALAVLQALAASLAAAQPASEGEAGLPLAPLAHDCLLRCAALLPSGDLQPQALAVAQALLPLLELRADAGTGDGTSSSGSGCLALAPVVAALTEALRLELLSTCTAAGVAPPASWASGFHALVLGPGTLGILQLIQGLVQRRPRLLSPQVLPPLLCDVLLALASHPVVDVSAPELHSWAVASLPALCPAAAAQLDAVAQLAQQQSDLGAAVQQLASAPTPALAAACCRELQQQLPALELLSEQEQERVVATSMAAAVQHGASPAAAALASRLLLHHQPAVRLAALAALDMALHTAGQAAPRLVLQPAVAGSLAVALGGESEQQQLAASILQVAAGQKCTLFEHVRPVLLGLFHSTPTVAAEAAQQLHTMLVRQRPAAAASMPFCLLPFDSLLLPAGTAMGQQDSAARAAAAAAARLFTAADVQSLLAVLASPSVQPDLAAAALGQLAQVAGDARFGVLLGREPVLAMLLRHVQDSSPCHHLQQPALACLVALAEQQPLVADWLLEDADTRCVPLLPLAFHPLTAVRQATAQLLDTLLFGTATRQLLSLADQLADGPAGALSPSTAASRQAAVPEPFCASYWMARPTAILLVEAALHPHPPVSVFASEEQQRLWRARQLCHTAAAGGKDGSGPSSLIQMLSGPSLAAAPARWEADHVRSSLAMLRVLQPEGLAAEGLRELAASESHQQCHAALRRLELLVAALPEGLGALAAAPWRDALDPLLLLLSAAPLSPEDCALWGDMLPLLQRLLETHPPGQRAAAMEAQLLMRLAEQFAGGSALSYVEQAGSEDHHAAALLPAVLHTVHLVVQHAGQRSSAEQRALLLEACRAEQWLELIAGRLEAKQWGYAVRVTALRLAGAVVDASRACAAPTSCPRLLAAVVRRVLMPRELWDTHHCHGKAAVLAALQLLLSITQALPAAEWAGAWAGVGSTFWLSRAAGDASPAVLQAALRLLAAALAVPATWHLLVNAWPECCEVASRLALDGSDPAEVRAAALAVIAAALSHGLGGLAGSDSPAASEAAESAGDSTEAGCPADASQLAAVPHLPPSSAAERLLLDRALWDGIEALLQGAEPGLLSAAAHTVLQRALLDAEGAVQLLRGGAVLACLLRQPAAALGDAPGDVVTLAPEQAAAATHAFRAAHAAAALLAALSRLALAECWADTSSAPGLLAAAASAFGWAASLCCRALPVLTEPGVAALQQSAQAALAPLADGIALLAQAGSPDQLETACSCTPLPLATAVATAASSPELRQAQVAVPVGAACCRLLAALLRGEAEARCFVQNSHGQEHQLPAAVADPDHLQPVGAVLGTYLMEQWLEAAAVAASGSEKDGVEQQQQQQQQVLDSALGGLLAFSASAKQVAVHAGLHSSLLDSCRALASSLAGPRAAAPLQPLPQPTAAAHRTAKLQQLREGRRGGAKQPAAALAFGSRAPTSAPAASKHGGSRSSGDERPGSRAVAAEAEQGPAAQPTDAEEDADVASQAEPLALDQQAASHHVHPQQRQQQLVSSLLGLLQRLAHNSASSSRSLVEAGAMDVVAMLWGTGGPAVQASLLALLATLLHSSAEARAACASAEPPLLERLVAAVLSGRSQPVAALSAFSSSPDGARALVHSSSIAARALRALQDQTAAKEWWRLLPTLQVLTDLCSQPEGQRALLACSTPSDTMLGVLLSLTEHSAPAAAAAAATAAMLLLRQLALCPEAKAHFVSRRGALQALLDAVRAAEAQPERAAAAAHALWALVHGGERVKVAVRRCEGWEQALGAALAACQQEGRSALRGGVDALQRLLAK